MENNSNISSLEQELTDIENRIKSVITSGLEMVKNDPSLEKDVLTKFITPAMRIYDFFLKETTRTGTESVGKNAFKYAMFKKF